MACKDLLSSLPPLSLLIGNTLYCVQLQNFYRYGWSKSKNLRQIDHNEPL